MFFRKNNVDKRSEGADLSESGPAKDIPEKRDAGATPDADTGAAPDADSVSGGTPAVSGSDMKMLRRMNRQQLLTLLVSVTEENERLRRELDEAKRQLEDRRIVMEKAGSIAEAALELNHVFEAAQQAADDYLNSLKDTQA